MINDKHMEIVVTADEASKRIDVYIAGRLKDYSRTFIQGLIDRGSVKVNSRMISRDHRVRSGEKVEICLPPPPEIYIEPEKIHLNIIHEDDSVLAVNKPAGMVVHPACGHYHGTLVNALMYHLKESPRKDNYRPGIVHRLDKNTSGIMIIAKTVKSHYFLAKEFASRRIEKKYLAIVRGEMEVSRGVIVAPVGRSPSNRLLMEVISSGRDAETSFRVKKILSGATLLELTPLTGRTHQIRVHMAHIGFPVVGDKEYNRFKDSIAASRQMLHAWKISFRHPENKERMELVAPVPADFRAVQKSARGGEE